MRPHHSSGIGLAIAGLMFVAAGAPAGARADDEVRPAVALPEGFIDDPMAGTIDGRALRLIHRGLGLPFRLIPGGIYVMGDDAHADSPLTQVELSPFYIAERQLSCADAAWLAGLRRRRHTEKNVREFDAQAVNGPEGLAADVAESNKTLALALAAIDAWIELGLSLKHWPSLPLTLDVSEESLPQGATRTLTDAQRLACDELSRAFEATISELAELGEAPFQPATFSAAMGLAETVGCRPPTEAEWEAAARLAANGDIGVGGLFDEVPEWCSDFYGHDYYDPTQVRKNPLGPHAGRLSADQLRSLTEDSAPPLRSRRISRRLHVVRGNGPSMRDFAYGVPRETIWSWSSAAGNRGVRLVATWPETDESRRETP